MLVIISKKNFLCIRDQIRHFAPVASFGPHRNLAKGWGIQTFTWLWKLKLKKCNHDPQISRGVNDRPDPSRPAFVPEGDKPWRLAGTWQGRSRVCGEGSGTLSASLGEGGGDSIFCSWHAE